MFHDAKFACANDATCSGLAEAPKRRGQNRKFGNYSLVDKEYILCDYPPFSKPTDDTLLLRKRGNCILSIKSISYETNITGPPFSKFNASYSYF